VVCIKELVICVSNEMVVCRCVWKGLLNVFGFLGQSSYHLEMALVPRFLGAPATIVSTVVCKVVDLISEAVEITYVLWPFDC